MKSIAENLKEIQKSIHIAEEHYQRSSGAVKLLAVTKGQSITKIQEAVQAGQKYFGENYLQEALPKIAALPNDNIQWHFIGTIQSNKTKAIAENFHWVQSVDRIKIAERLNQQRPVQFPPLNVCIEVNVSGEMNKSGIVLSGVNELALAIQQMPRLKLRGLMTIPAATHDFVQQCIPYRKLHEVWLQLREQGFALDILSMGMSNDFEAAIAEGSTMVRIGTAIFGPR